MTRSESATLQLLTGPRWLSADAGAYDIPDSLPGYLLVYLAYRGEWMTRDALAAAFWPERNKHEALHNLRANLHRVRALLAGWKREASLRSDQRRVRIDLPSDIAVLRAALARGDWIAAAEARGEALLASMTFRGFAQIEAWASDERRALAALWRDAAYKAAQALEQRGGAGPAADLLLRLAQTEVPTEKTMQDLLRLAADAGRRAEALAVFQRFRAWLSAELQLQPSHATQALADALRKGDVAAPARVASAPSGSSGSVAHLFLFGPPELAGARRTPFAPERRFQLLVVLAMRSGEWVTRDQIASLLWPEQSGSDARRNLRHALFKAHTTPGAEGVEATHHALRWTVATDVQAFQSAVRDKRFADAVALRRGPLADGIDDADNRPFSEWLAAERTRMEARWHEAALDHLQSLSDSAQRIALAQRLLQADPLDEEAMRVLLAAEVAFGHRAKAQRLYRDYAARLADELGVEPPQHLRDLLAGAPLAPAGTSPGDGTEFVGRRTELGELALLLGQPECRLITILGPGGVGKSSLARRALSNVGASFPGGAVWVDLQDLDEAPAVLGRLARQLGLEINETQDPIKQIAGRLQTARTLAVLDNAEHLGELPALIDLLLAAAPALAIVLTSRTRSHSRHERLLPLDGLAVPDEESRDLEVASTFDAIRLFELRATAAQREFRLAAHLAAVLETVNAVSGLPLAIELAAAWTRLIPPEEIARDLRSAIDMLERDPAAAGAPARPEHVSLRAVLDRSWQLLAPRERDAMTALSVFHGGFTHAAARYVGDVSLPVLSSLVDKSMLKVDPGGRFDTHPLVGSDATARARLDEVRLTDIKDRHAEHFVRHLTSRLGEQAGDPRPIVEAVDADQANCLLAWRHAIGRGRHDLVASMHPAWRAYFGATGKYGQSVRHFEEALSMGGPPQMAAELRETLAYFLVRNREPERAAALASESLVVAEALGDSTLAQGCAATIGGCKLVLGQWREARSWIERSLGLAREQGARRETASALSNLGLITAFLGEFDRAIGLYEEAITIQTELGNNVNVARAMCNLGFVHVARGDWPRAQQELDKALRYALDRGINAVALEAEFLLGSTQVELGLLDAAQRRLEHAREGFRVTRNAGFELKTGYYLARIAARRGLADQAGRDLLASVRTAREHDWTYDVLYAAIFVAELLALRGCAREAAQVLRSIRTAPRAHAFVGTLAEAGLRALPAEWANTDAAEPRAAAFDLIADLMVASSDLDELVSRLQAAAA